MELDANILLPLLVAIPLGTISAVYQNSWADYAAMGISLGVFSDEEAARTTRGAREKEGYDVQMVEIPRLSREFWVFSTTSRDLDVSAELWGSLVSRHQGLEKKAMPCTARQAESEGGSGASG